MLCFHLAHEPEYCKKPRDNIYSAHQHSISLGKLHISVQDTYVLPIAVLLKYFIIFGSIYLRQEGPFPFHSWRDGVDRFMTSIFH